MTGNTSLVVQIDISCRVDGAPAQYPTLHMRIEAQIIALEQATKAGVAFGTHEATGDAHALFQ
ncbi:hypothetical protein D3C78_1795890 [compost metagenome]